MNLTFESIQYHRNGIAGAPFHILTFRDSSQGRMIGIVFEDPHRVAVLNLDKLASGDIAFGSNSFRGDVYESHLRAAINLHNPSQGV